MLFVNKLEGSQWRFFFRATPLVTYVITVFFSGKEPWRQKPCLSSSIIDSCLLAHMLWPVSVSWTQQFIMNRVNKTLVFMFPRIVMKCHLLNITLKELEFYFLNSYSVVMWKTNQELVTTIFYMFEYSMHLLMDITSILLLNPYDQDHDLVMRNLLFTSSNLLWSLSWKIPLLVAVVGSFSFNKSHFIR